MLVPLSILFARTAKGSLMVGGQDILSGLSVQDVSFSYTDSTSDKADDLCVEIADPARNWMMKFLPNSKGVQCTAKIAITDWKRPYDNRELDCGIFWINDIDFKGPPNTVTVKASSIPPNGLKGTKKHRAWENSDLKSIATQIAKDNQLQLFYDTQNNPKVKRTDQADKPDIQYLRERCKESQLSLKVHKGQIVIYSEEEYDSRPPAFMLVYGASQIINYNFHWKCDDTFKESHNAYVNPETGKVSKAKFNPKEETGEGPDGTDALLIHNEAPDFGPDEGGGGSGLVLLELQNVDNWNDAPSANAGKGTGDKGKGKCKSKLREKNKKEHQCTFNVFGNIDYLSGLCCQTKGYGIFDKKWFVESSTHKISSSGYLVDLKLRGALKGY